MFTKISWSEFLNTIFFLSAFYYIAVIILYYRKDILKWSTHGVPFNNFHSKQSDMVASQPQSQKESTTHSLNASRPMSYNEMTVASIEESLYKEDNASNKKVEAKFNPADVHELIEEMKTIFSGSQKKKTTKQELILTIHNKLGEYEQLKGTEIEKEIIQHIANESKEKCAVDLNKEELENLWKV